MGNINDLFSSTYSVSVVTSNTDSVVGGSCIVFGIYITANGTDAQCGLVAYDIAALAGVPITTRNLRVRAIQDDSNSVEFGPSGIQFDTDLSIQFSNTPTSATVVYKAD